MANQLIVLDVCSGNIPWEIFAVSFHHHSDVPTSALKSLRSGSGYLTDTSWSVPINEAAMLISGLPFE